MSVKTTIDEIRELPRDSGLFRVTGELKGAITIIGTGSIDSANMTADDLIALAESHERLEAEVEHLENTAPLRREKLNQLIHYRNKSQRLEQIIKQSGIELLENGDYQYKPKYVKHYVGEKTQERIERLEQALRHYADENTWFCQVCGNDCRAWKWKSHYLSVVKLPDGGNGYDIAQQALAGLEEKTK